MYDLIVIGGGVVGFGAGMYAGRMGMKTLVIGDTWGGTIILTDIVENYPGFIRLTGQELSDKLKEHAQDYKEFVDFLEERVTDVEKEMDCFRVTVGDKSYISKTILFATGTKHRELKVPGHDEYKNKGVHYCALCDGYFYKDKVVAVVGGSDSAAKEALVLAQLAKKVYIIYRGDQIHPEPINMRRIEDWMKKGKIEIIYNSNVVEIKGDDQKVTSAVLDNPYKGSKELKLDALFVAIGLIPLSDLAKNLGVKINQKGEIEIDRVARTNIPGVYAAGDVADTPFKQAITGVSEGVHAVYQAYTYINENQLVCPTTDPEEVK